MNSMDTFKMRMNSSNPSFFKILLDETASNLPLPPVFVRKQFLEGRFPENPLLQIESGEKWGVKIRKIGEKYCFGNGWLEFVKDTKTEAGDFLVFWLIGNSVFQVSIYGPNGSVKDLSFVTSTTCKCVCNCGRSKIAKSGLSKTPKHVIKMEDEDEDEDEEDEEVEEVEEDEDDKDEEDADEDDKNEEDADEDKDDKDENDEDDEEETQPQNFDWMEESVDMCFEKVIQKSHSYAMTFPKRFMQETRIESQKKTVVRNKEGKEWSIKIGRWGDGRFYLANGWLNFWKENKIMEGDTCSFRYSHGERGRNCFIQFDFVKKVARKRGRPPLNRSLRK